MSDPGSNRPRRAWDPEDLTSDDTPVETTAARRYAFEDESASTQDQSESHEPAAPLNPFARPGSASAQRPLDTPVPAPVLPSRHEGAAHGRHMGGEATGPVSAPRRSAASSATPAEWSSESSAADGESSGATVAVSATWWSHYGRTVLIFGVGIIALAVLLGGGIFAFQLANAPTAQPTVMLTTQEGPTASPSAPPVATEDDLIDETDADRIVPGATWVVTNTAAQRSDFAGRPICLSNDPSRANPTITLQRQLGTSDDDGLAALHQIDVYTSDEVAQETFNSRLQQIASCDDVPVYLESADRIDSFADQAIAVHFVDQQDPAIYHTIMMVRHGTAVSVMDVVRDNEPLAADDLLAGLSPKVSGLCQRSGGSCPTEPAVVNVPPPATEPKGWLINADLPRITAGTGQWSGQNPTQLTLQGTSCENISLATQAGPTQRQQRTFVLTQDAQTPTQFGLDQVRFSFDSNSAATDFAELLITNFDGCQERLEGAQVTKLGDVHTQNSDGSELEAKLYDITLETSDTETVEFLVAVSAVDNNVYYLVATVTDDYRFNNTEFSLLARRAMERATQV